MSLQILCNIRWDETYQFLFQNIKRIMKVLNGTGIDLLQSSRVVYSNIIFLVSCTTLEDSAGMLQLERCRVSVYPELQTWNPTYHKIDLSFELI